MACLSCLGEARPKQEKDTLEGRPSSLTVSLTRPLRFWVVRPASQRSRSWTGHGNFSRGLSQEGSAVEPLPQRALPRKRSTLASQRHWTSLPTRSTARPPPPAISQDLVSGAVPRTGPAKPPFVPESREDGRLTKPTLKLFLTFHDLFNLLFIEPAAVQAPDSCSITGTVSSRRWLKVHVQIQSNPVHTCFLSLRSDLQSLKRHCVHLMCLPGAR